MAEPHIEPAGTGLCVVRGTFFRAVAPEHAGSALAGSRAAGRYSPPDVPTLYLSSSREGVAAAMIAHSDRRAPDLDVLGFEVAAHGIADLRDEDAMAALGIDPGAAAAPWQDDVAADRIPASWRLRDGLERLGANGLIDPSRKRPGLWHLALFAWNRAGAPSVVRGGSGVSDPPPAPPPARPGPSPRGRSRR